MKSITQFLTDSNYSAIVSPNGRYVIKHSSEENYKGCDEIFLLYDSGKKIREIIGENCLFINNEYLLKFPFWGYSEDCGDLTLIRLSDNSVLKIDYPEDIESYLIARTAVFSRNNERVYYFSNVQSAIKDFTNFLYSIDINLLVNSRVVKIFETELRVEPKNTFLDIYENSLVFFDKNVEPIKLKLPIETENEILAYPKYNLNIIKIDFINRFITLDTHTISSTMNPDGSFSTIN